MNKQTLIWWELKNLRACDPLKSNNHKPLSEAGLIWYISQQDITLASTLLQQLLLVCRELWLEAGKTGKITFSFHSFHTLRVTELIRRKNVFPGFQFKINIAFYKKVPTTLLTTNIFQVMTFIAHKCKLTSAFFSWKKAICEN